MVVCKTRHLYVFRCDNAIQPTDVNECSDGTTRTTRRGTTRRGTTRRGTTRRRTGTRTRTTYDERQCEPAGEWILTLIETTHAIIILKWQ